MAEEMKRAWLIEDELDSQQAQVLFGAPDLQLEVSHPDDENFADKLSEVWHLILVDEELWPNEPDRAPPQAVDGASLISGLRAWGRQKARQLPPVVILTNQERAFSGEPPAVGASRPVIGAFRGHEGMVAPTIDADWLLSKNDPDVKEKIYELASAYSKAVSTFQMGGISLDELVAFLGADRLEGDRDYHVSRVRLARPPVNEEDPNLPTPARGPATAINWLLNRALTFPGLFVSDFFAAQSLGLTIDGLKEVLQSKNAFSERIRACMYAGPLHSLAPRRYWSSALDLLAITLPEDLKAKSIEIGIDQAKLDDGQSTMVVVVDEKLFEVDLCKVQDAVRVRPKAWPSEAAQPWMRKDLARSKPWLLDWVELADRSRLEE